MRFQSVLVSMFSLVSVSTIATTVDDVTAVIQGQNLAQQLLEQHPTENFTNIGVLKIRDATGMTSKVPVKFEIIAASTNWQSVYKAFFTNATETLVIIHDPYQRDRLTGDYLGAGSLITGSNGGEIGPLNSYRHEYPTPAGSGFVFPDGRMAPFANSDFLVADLGLEFFNWPQQKILPKTTNLKRGREYTLLESTNPNPSTNGYSRVLSWIDKESGGILEAEAYDTQGKLLKVFEPKSFKKVNGQWQLQEMEIRNVQTGSRTRLQFDLKQP